MRQLEVRTKTFIAPAEGGTLDGKMMRMESSIGTIYNLVGAARVTEVYERLLLADGSTIWKFAGYE